MEYIMNEDQETLVNEESDDSSTIDSTVTDSNDTTTNEAEITEEDLNNLSDDEFTKWLDNNEVIPQDASLPNQTEQAETEEKPEEDKKQDVQKQPEQPQNIDYKAFYDAIFKPFKANGKEITPRSLDDVVHLMQQGANYTKKMQVLAPVRKQALLLQQEGIDTDTLNYLIDLKNGNVEAIKKLLKDNKVDLTEIDTEAESTYQATRHDIADSQLEFQDTLDDVRPNLPKINEVITKWDSASRNKIYENPTLLQAINWEINSGRFDNIVGLLEQERTFGRYKGVNDVDAFVDIVQKIDYMQAQEAIRQQQQQSQNTTANSTNKQSKPTKPIADKSKAAPNKSKPTSPRHNLTPQMLLDMSDEEFLKLKESDLY